MPGKATHYKRWGWAPLTRVVYLSRSGVTASVHLGPGQTLGSLEGKGFALA